MNSEYMLDVNGVDYPISADTSRNLLSVIRNEVGLTGTKEGCDDCECGACMVLLDGQPVNSCSYLAAQAAGRRVTTIEGVMDGDELHALQRTMLEEGGVQCGFCTPGFVVTAAHLFGNDPSPDEETIREAFSGNICRCTGYGALLRSFSRLSEEDS